MSKLDRPSSMPPLDPKAAHLGSGVEAIKRDFLANLYTRLAKFPAVANTNDYYRALAYTVRDRMLERWINTAQVYFQNASRTVSYLSAEFLIGPQLGTNLMYLGIADDARKAMESLGLDMDELLEHEEEPGLGNGGLGRLAACYMDSLATLGVPAIGYGIRYEFGIFDQQIRDGWQHEVTDKWLRLGNPWEIPRYDIELSVKLGGYTEGYQDARGRYRVRWHAERIVKGHCYDTPLCGFGIKNANMLRLWEATAAESFDFQAFNVGDYLRAVQEKVVSENLTKVLYPNDEPEAGKILRLEQQYFFVSCSLQDMIRLHLQRAKSVKTFYDKYAIQLNDTHPALAVAELMRLFLDEHDLDWGEAWDITTKTFGYTNHTLLPEALESWSLPLFKRVLPRHLEIIYEINRRFLDEARFRLRNVDEETFARLSLIDEHGEKKVRMANLACVGSHHINGVAALHTELLKQTVLADFYALWPEKFSNVTNGVTPRRFMALSNPPLTKLISDTIGESWLRDLTKLSRLEKHIDEAGFRDAWQAAKLTNKTHLANYMKRLHGVDIDPQSLFDVQVKRMHEYKRQHLNALHVISMYQRIKAGRGGDITPRTVFFGGKAAPGYWLAKLVIKLIHSVAEVVNHDRDTRDILRVVFIPDFNVKVAQNIYPAAELSEQISTAGKEASGTGNMKFQMNGALTIGTLDGANVEIREEVGEENFFLFGLTTDEVVQTRLRGYNPRAQLEQHELLREVIDLLQSGYFSRGDKTLFDPILQRILGQDDYMLMADFPSYLEAQDRVSGTYRDRERWTRMSILNSARSGKFSSDRSIREYCENIWHIGPVSVEPK